MLEEKFTQYVKPEEQNSFLNVSTVLFVKKKTTYISTIYQQLIYQPVKISNKMLSVVNTMENSLSDKISLEFP